MKSHKQKIYPSKLLARYQEGDILGDINQEGEWYKAENWCISRWNTVVACFSISDFSKIWSLYQDKWKNISIFLIHSWKILRQLSKYTIWKLHEKMETRLYKAGSLICPQSKKSPINKEYWVGLHFILFRLLMLQLHQNSKLMH